MNKIHWRNLMKVEYLDASEIEKDVTLTVSKVEKVLTYSRYKKGEEHKLVLHFEKTYKKLILSAKNLKAIIKIAKSYYIDDWVGQQITLTREPSAKSESGFKIVIKNESKPLNA